MIAMLDAPGNATGTPDQVIESLSRLRELGCDYVICYFPEAAYDRSGIEMFEREVIPALSGGWTMTDSVPLRERFRRALRERRVQPHRGAGAAHAAGRRQGASGGEPGATRLLRGAAHRAVAA